jgi:hypothetical protein
MNRRDAAGINNENPLLLGLVLERATRAVGLRDVQRALAATRSGRRRFLEPRLRRLEVREDRERDWVRAATAAQTPTDFPNPYGYFW